MMQFIERQRNRPGGDGGDGGDAEGGGGRLESIARRADRIAARGAELANRSLSGNHQAFLAANLQRGAQ
ncbi:MAG: hypothetical protein KA184_04425 [Candidatus Hydrogenedentes bacterium]|nr:hypothetical protein [Candidatus Hydrogenedentota bacterium]